MGSEIESGNDIFLFSFLSEGFDMWHLFPRYVHGNWTKTKIVSVWKLAICGMNESGNLVNQYSANTISLVSYKSPSWISGRRKMTVENISWSIVTKVWSSPGLNTPPLDQQSDSLPIALRGQAEKDQMHGVIAKVSASAKERCNCWAPRLGRLVKDNPDNWVPV